MKILISDTDSAHSIACENKILEECPTATTIRRLESLAASVTWALANGYDIISRSTTGLSDARNEYEGDLAWDGVEIISVFGTAKFGIGKFGGTYLQRVGIVHALGSNSHVRDTDPSRLDIISAVSGGDGAGNCASSYGPGLEYFYNDELAQSYATSRLAGIIGQLMIDHPTWTFMDARQALRQTASLYGTGWIEDGGYGYVQKVLADAVTDFDLSSPIRKEYTSSEALVEFAWLSNPQSDFSNTVIAMFDSEPDRDTVPTAGQIIYAGTLEEFDFNHCLGSSRWFAFYTRNAGLDYSLAEDNADTSYWFDKVEIDLEYIPSNISCTLTDNNISCTLTDNNISATLT